MIKNIKLTIEYNGTSFYGWQKQPNARTVQGTIEECIAKVTQEEVEVIGCSRTDSGVHAKRFVCNFATSSKIPSEKFSYAINRILPPEIIILESEEVPLDFHARFSCKGKRYVYSILSRTWPSPIKRGFTYHVKDELDIDKMNEAARYLIGRHDFASFRNLGSSVQSTVRTITELSIIKNNELIEIKVAGDGFLYNMVRIISGTLLDVGLNRKEPKDIKVILESRDRRNAGRSLPAAGLCLDEVFYY